MRNKHELAHGGGNISSALCEVLEQFTESHCLALIRYSIGGGAVCTQNSGLYSDFGGGFLESASTSRADFASTVPCNEHLHIYASHLPYRQPWVLFFGVKRSVLFSSSSSQDQHTTVSANLESWDWLNLEM